MAFNFFKEPIKLNLKQYATIIVLEGIVVFIILLLLIKHIENLRG